MTQILIFGFDIKPHLAIGTDSPLTAFAKLSGTVSLSRRSLVVWHVLGHVALGSVHACFVSLYVTQQLSTALKKTRDRISRSPLSVSLAYAGLKLIAF